ncbi:protein S-acyltransferase 10 isoform X1 [Lactuca sativa]|uniref:S-acyltransferase n=1 Tax=Lactuca sativa TaxID=4236 RepID=A0A9R1XWA6_LACSA|nr:protein S-acyltransferase 10 isoform X1 [Lactuca sativa]KAJ0221717.1 hypothetical protein LSAT_V11C200077310 [Lactuca sativa]
MSFLGSSGDPSDSYSDRCSKWIPCLSDPPKRSALCMQLMLVVLHLVFLGFLFIFDSEFMEKLKTLSWSTICYLLLFVATIVQYLYTSGSSPGYVLDAMREFARAEASLRASETSNKDNLLQAKNDSVVVTFDGNQRGENILGNNRMNWTKMVMDLYPSGTAVRTCTCTFCNVVQPPRTKHCHDCEKCVLQFDHHCVWLGTCVGQGNHCRFWWYIFEEFALCIWTGIWYINYLNDHVKDSWVKDIFVIIMLAILAISLIFLFLLLVFHTYLIMTNQTTYELVRRRRIHYMRSIPERVHPFSKGVCRNLYDFCCARTSNYRMEALPFSQGVDQMSIP